ncbi:TadE family protein [Streptomyces sp. NPDC000410]|uniref:TadE family protein n=1 Tax=Streptomyces sp. NPDC000410 TaxID=3154254 RepID=UPI00331B2D52
MSSLAITRRKDRGQTAVEFIGFLPILMIVCYAVIQLGIAAYAVQQAGTAARAAARIESHDNAGDPVAGGRAAVDDMFQDGTDITVSGAFSDEARATATVEIPSLIPGLFEFDPIERSATFPRD